jgi:hypothetical protein
MKLYCENCGKQLKHIRQALPKLGIIVDLVAYHECSEEPIPFEINPSEVVEAAPVADKQKFVKSLNELKLTANVGREIGHSHSEGRSLRPSSMTGTDDLRDQRFDKDLKPISTAPSTVLDQIKQMGNSIPVHDVRDEPTDSEMGD